MRGNFGSKNGTAQMATVTVTYGKGAYNSGMRATRSGWLYVHWLVDGDNRWLADIRRKRAVQAEFAVLDGRWPVAAPG